jgi:acetoin utilization deacetylase AcuC-like enzyme
MRWHDTGAGYCVFNDLAIAAVRLVEEGTVERVLVVDCDVHQGDGTAALDRGAGGSPPIPSMPRRTSRCARRVRRWTWRWPDGTGDENIWRRWRRPGAAAESFRPDLILYQAGSIRSRATGWAGWR